MRYALATWEVRDLLLIPSFMFSIQLQFAARRREPHARARVLPFKSDQIDVGVLIVDSPSKLGRISTDLIWLRSTLTLPLWVIALK